MVFDWWVQLHIFMQKKKMPKKKMPGKYKVDIKMWILTAVLLETLLSGNIYIYSDSS